MIVITRHGLAIVEAATAVIAAADHDDDGDHDDDDATTTTTTTTIKTTIMHHIHGFTRAASTFSTSHHCLPHLRNHPRVIYGFLYKYVVHIKYLYVA